MASSTHKEPDLSNQTDLVFPWALRVAATLRLADRIASGVTHLQELAVHAGVNADALGRLLRYLISYEVFAEPAPGLFTLTDAARFLQESHPLRLRAWLDQEGAGGRMDGAWNGLLQAVRTGEAAYPSLYGCTFWEDLAAHPHLEASFNELMVNRPSRVDDAFIAEYDWAGVRHVVDVGGGSGRLLAALLRAHPAMRGTLVDLPGTVSAAREAFSSSELAGRCEIIAGSFFDPLPSGGDVYLLSFILHDWSDREALAILRRCAQAAGTSGRVLIRENLVGTDNDQPLVRGQDLLMLVLFGGRERTLEAFAELANTSGMTLQSTRCLSTNLFLLECIVQ